MNKKRIRTAIICALVAVMAIFAIFNIKIEVPESTDKKISVSKTEVKNTPDKPSEKKETVLDTAGKKEGNSQEEAVGEVPVIENQEEPSVQAHVCTIEIRCDTVKDTSKIENEAVIPYVPQSGVILEKTEVEFTQGESVFDILLRATRDRDIHMEFRDDGAYSGKYIEGINYLYEMDAGPLSGWMYKVNGQFPNYGCAAYKVNDGDAIVWMYTCDLGLDVGDNSVW